MIEIEYDRNEHFALSKSVSILTKCKLLIKMSEALKICSLANKALKCRSKIVSKRN